ncbi:MAG TPA: hypothetical protein VHC42_10160 [Rhizomicrobium sp.]|jgi:hypothetical protein|nr:hypothetical protein [Rhizomicrobium sp.]
MSAFALTLAAAAVAGWIVLSGARAASRAYGRMACALVAALAAAWGIDPRLAQSVTLIVSAVAPVLIAAAALARFRRPPAPAAASLALALAAAAGILSSASGVTALAFAPFLIATLAAIAAALRALRRDPAVAIQFIGACCALLAAASAFLAHGPSAEPSLLLFYAVGVLGSALSLARRSAALVDQPRPLRASPTAAIGDPGR